MTIELNPEHKDNFSVKEPFKSLYFMNVLPMVTQNVWHMLVRNTLTKCEQFSNGLIIANIKQDTLLAKFGNSISRSTLCRSLAYLDEIGAIVVCGKNKFENNKYILGFRGRGEHDRFYLLDHLIMEYEPTLKQIQENYHIKYGYSKHKEDFRMPPITDTIPYRMNEAYKQILKDNVNRPDYLLQNIVKDGKNVFQLLFRRNDFFKLPLQRTKETSSKLTMCVKMTHGVCQNDTRSVSK